jgi:hypothetical protein
LIISDRFCPPFHSPTPLENDPMAFLQDRTVHIKTLLSPFLYDLGRFDTSFSRIMGETKEEYNTNNKDINSRTWRHRFRGPSQI